MTTQVELHYLTEEDEITGDVKRILRLMRPSADWGTGPESITKDFMSAMDEFASRSEITGEKGGECYTEFGLGDMRLALFQILRNTPRQKIREYIRNCIAQAKQEEESGSFENSIQIQLDLFRLAMQTRDKDEGKGERDLTYWILVELHKWYPKTVRRLIKLLPTKYGCWLDFMKLITIFEDEMNNTGKYASVVVGDSANVIKVEVSKTVGFMLKYMCETFRNDENSESPSLLAKWWPREGGKYTALGRRLAIMLFAIFRTILVILKFWTVSVKIL